MDRRWSARAITRGQTTTVCPSVFHRRGAPIGDFRKARATACIAAGFSRPRRADNGQPVLTAKGEPVFEPTLIFDDLRRSAVRNLDRAGVSQVVAMSITGHKTVSVYHRYRVVRIDDQRRALEQAHAVIESGPNVVPMTRREAAER